MYISTSGNYVNESGICINFPQKSLLICLVLWQTFTNFLIFYCDCISNDLYCACELVWWYLLILFLNVLHYVMLCICPLLSVMTGANVPWFIFESETLFCIDFAVVLTVGLGLAAAFYHFEYKQGFLWKCFLLCTGF